MKSTTSTTQTLVGMENENSAHAHSGRAEEKTSNQFTTSPLAKSSQVTQKRSCQTSSTGLTTTRNMYTSSTNLPQPTSPSVLKNGNSQIQGKSTPETKSGVPAASRPSQESTPPRMSTFKAALHNAMNSLRQSQVNSPAPSEDGSISNMDLSSDKNYFAKLTQGLKKLDNLSHAVQDKIRNSVQGESPVPREPLNHYQGNSGQKHEELSNVDNAKSRSRLEDFQKAPSPPPLLKQSKTPGRVNSEALQKTVPKAPPPPPLPKQSSTSVNEKGKRRRKRKGNSENAEALESPRRNVERRPSKVEEISTRLNEAEERAPFNVGDRMSLTNRFRPGYETTDASWNDADGRASSEEDYRMTARRFSTRYSQIE